uniref:BGGP Beta-1-3-galactosyl-O-glycosyl-glycoprotein n=2 Tax=Hordeum vulgare subsp. vulgare TaxID=112509 RepID=A0A8I6YKG7_HORVV
MIRGIPLAASPAPSASSLFAASLTSSQPPVATMDCSSVPLPRNEHLPAGSQPDFVTLDIRTPSLHGRRCAGIDLRWVHSVAAGGILSLFLLAASGIAFPATSLFLHPYHSSATQSPSPAGPPRFAYLVSGSAGDATRLRRCLLALYHPRNHYILHLDAEAPDSEYAELTAFVATHPVLAAVGNVRVLEKANLVVANGGIAMVTTTLRAAATFLRGARADWDWFINLSASDYPLVTQDDLMDVFSRLPRDLNFIVDPGVFMNETENFTGSAWMVLSRPFVEYLIRGRDNLPRTLIVYHTDFVSSPDGYFHTVACNAEEFRNTIMNHNMHYISSADSPGHHPELITSGHWEGMIGSDAPFASKFGDDPVLDKIDAELLSRQPGMLAPGSWSIGDIGGDGSFWIVRDATPLRPGPGAARLQRLVTSLLSKENFRPKQCQMVNHNA